MHISSVKQVISMHSPQAIRQCMQHCGIIYLMFLKRMQQVKQKEHNMQTLGRADSTIMKYVTQQLNEAATPSRKAKL